MNRKNYILILALILSVVSCTQKGNDKTKSVEKSLEVELDTTGKMIKFENTLFSVPSPYQLSILIKELGTDYNPELLNPYTNNKLYTDLFKKAVNLGIYGADLAYLNIYEQSPSAIKYFSVIKILAQDLGLTSAFSPDVFERIENNVDNKDSLLFIMSATYRDVDYFLKENQRQREGALVLAGGWIEGMHLLLNLAEETKNKELIQRVGENRQPLENLIKILSPYYNESENIKKLVDSLIDLAYDFDAVEIKYTYVEPEVIPEQKLTKIHSKSEVVVPDSVLQSIRTKLDNVRSSLIK